MKKFKEYTAPKYSRYREPVRKFASDVLAIRLYCYHRRCRKYIKGKEGYNRAFTAETGQRTDLRNQVWWCNKHQEHQEKLGSKQKLFLKLTPIGVWLKPSQKNFKRHGIRNRVIV